MDNKIVVMKFGGSSVANVEKIKHVASRVMAKKNEGYHVVVVVSAPGDTTDDLVKMAYDITKEPDNREMDMLLSTGELVSISLLTMAIKHKGSNAISLTGGQVGIKTDKEHTKARITGIDTTKIDSELKKDNIVIVAGFQGTTDDSTITTLGRGGSDLTAVALAAVLKAYQCEIYTDVKGIYTTDPRLIKEASKIEKISYDEMLEMAGLGAQVMQSRSIEVAKKYNVVIHVRSTFSEEEGTLITGEDNEMEDVLVSGIAFDRKQVKCSITALPDKPGIAAKLFSELATNGVNVDMIVQSSAENKENDIAFTIHEGELKKALDVLNKFKDEVKSGSVSCDENIAKVSIVGVGMKSHTGVASKMFGALAEEQINIDMISTSEIKISSVIHRDMVDKAVKALHKAFELEK